MFDPLYIVVNIVFVLIGFWNKTISFYLPIYLFIRRVKVVQRITEWHCIDFSSGYFLSNI